MKKIIFVLFISISTYCNASTNWLADTTQPIAWEDHLVYTKVDVLPSFIGGDIAWQDYLKKNLKYPKKAWWDEIETDVLVEFIVEKDGSITNVKHLTISEKYGFELEAVKLVQKSGKWIPATLRGNKVSYLARLNIPFRLK